MVAASLAGSKSEPAARVRVANGASAQVDHSCEVLTLLYRGGGNVVVLERSRDRVIEERRGHLHSITRHDARVERVEPTRSQIVPVTVLDDDMVMDAVVPRLCERPVGGLKHP